MQHKRNPQGLLYRIACVLIGVVFCTVAAGEAAKPRGPQFRIIALAEHGGIHQPFVEAAKIWLNKLAADDNFTVDYIENTDPINEAFLSRYKLFIQLNYPPYKDRKSVV